MDYRRWKAGVHGLAAKAHRNELIALSISDSKSNRDRLLPATSRENCFACNPTEIVMK